MKLSEFNVGQRVKQYDADEKQFAYGRVTEIVGGSVWIKWDDLNEPVEHNDETDLSTIQERGNP